MSEAVLRNPEELISLYSDRLDKSSERLARNIFLQFIFVGLSVYSFVFGGEPFAKLSEKYFGFGADQQILQMLIMLMLVFLFMRFGFLVSTFVTMRLACHELLKSYVPSRESARSSAFIGRLFDTDSLLEPVFHSYWSRTSAPPPTDIEDIYWTGYWRFLSIMAVLSLAILISFNNACVLLYLQLLFGGALRFGVWVIAACVLIPFYVGFYGSNLSNLEPIVNLVAVLTPFVALLIAASFLKLVPLIS